MTGVQTCALPILKKLLNENKFFSELADVFSLYGYDVRVSAIEKVLVMRVKDLNSCGVEIGGTPFRTDYKVPCAAQIYFAIDSRLK